MDLTLRISFRFQIKVALGKIFKGHPRINKFPPTPNVNLTLKTDDKEVDSDDKDNDEPDDDDTAAY